MKRVLLFLIVCVIALALTACDSEDPFNIQNDFSMVPAPYDTTGVDKVVTQGGLIIYTHNPGEGEFTVTERDRVALFFTFRIKKGDKMEIIQSSYANGRIFPDELNLATTVVGFQRGLVGLKEGGRRTLVIPPNLGYGNTNNRFRNETLYYDVDLVQILD